MTTASSIPNPTVPLIGPDGRLSQVWYQWFVTLFRRTGDLLGGSLSDVAAEASSGTPTPDLTRLDAIAPVLEAGVSQPDFAQVYGLIYAVEAMAAQAMATGPLLARIADLEAQLLSGPAMPAAVLTEGAPIGAIQPSTGTFTSVSASSVSASGGVSGGSVSAAGSLSGGSLAISPTTTTTAPAAGGAGALPATPAGYATITINGTSHQIPYY
jgi:hypothetical protein